MPLRERAEFARLVDPDAGRVFHLANFDAQLALDERRLVDIMRAIYDALAAFDVQYSHEADADLYTQSVRTATEILEGEKRGTCIDLAILFAGACLTYKLLPLLILQDGHAIVAVSRNYDKNQWNSNKRGDDEPFEQGQGLSTDAAEIQKLIEAGAYEAVDCTGFVVADNRYRFVAPDTPAPGGKLRFEDACAAARSQLAKNLPSLVAALDIAALQEREYKYGSGPGDSDPLRKSPRRLRADWTDWELKLRGVLFERELGDRPALLPSPLLASWRTFLNQEPWPNRVRKRVARMAAEKQHATQPLIDEIVAKLGHLDWTQPYAAIADQARQQRIDALLRQLNTRLAALARRPRGRAVDPTSEESDVRDLFHAAQECQTLFERPDYHICFPVLGSSGSGKTHFIASLLASSKSERDTLVMPLHLDGPQEGVDEWICRCALEAGRVRFASVEQLNQFLVDAKLRLVLVVDDLHEMEKRWSGVAPALRTFIAMHSHCAQIRWIVTSLDTRYDDLVDDKGFWTRYGVTADTSLTGWLTADLFNEGAHLGHRLLDERGQGRVRLDDDIDPATSRLLDSPLMAWLLLDIAAERDAPLTVVNLHFIELMKALWDACKRRQPALRTSRGVEALRKRLATRLAETGADRVQVDDFVREVVERERGGLDARAVDDLLRMFRDVALLSCVKAPGAEDSLLSAEVAYRVEDFWCWTIALMLVDKAEDPPGTVMQRCRATLANNPRGDIAETVWEFLLLFDDRRARDRPGGPARSLLEAYLDERSTRAAEPHLDAALWFAAAKASSDVQRMVAARGGELLSREPGRRSVFSVLYFVLSATGVDRAALFQLVQPLFRGIAAAQLERYFLHAVRQQLDAEDDPVQISRALGYLVGAEVMGIDEELAGVAIEALADCCDRPADMIPLVVEHVGTAPVPPGTRSPRRGEGTLRQWLFHRMCDRLLAEDGIETFELLKGTGWYAGRSGTTVVSSSVKGQMRSAANFAFGHWYRTRYDQRERERYEELVDDLLQSKLASDRELAFYLIRHSVATHKEEAVRVDAHFRAGLERLRRDPELPGLRVKWRSFFDINLAATSDQQGAAGRS